MEQDPTSSDLEHFRQEWQQEVQSRAQQKSTRPSQARTNSELERSKIAKPVNSPPTRQLLVDRQHEDGAEAAQTVTKTVDHVKLTDADEDGFSKVGQIEPQTALEHYERAVEKEGQGKLGDSLFHYRRAFKLDENVDTIYKQKHFSYRWKQAKPNPPDDAITVPNTAHHSQPVAGDESVPQTSVQLIASWADCQIPNANPLIEGDVPPPCPIRRLPTEVLLELLRTIAIIDVSVYARLASVCKFLAYHVHTESNIWKRVALGPEFGLTSQSYHFETTIQGRPIIWQPVDEQDFQDEDEKPTPQITESLFPDQDFREVFHSHPRIRFTGVYISTVNYTRSGGASVTMATWGSQVHIVTYYRYIRFFRDGTCLNLLTTHEPAEVVSLLTKENVALARAEGKGGKSVFVDPLSFTNVGHTLTGAAPPPSAQAILKHALRGRWRLCHPSLGSISVGTNTAVPGDIHIETEAGAGPRYLYTLHLSLKHGNAKNRVGVRNNKLVWKGFWSYNTVTEDWAEFQLRHDKAFWFSRVKSYGLGY